MWRLFTVLLLAGSVDAGVLGAHFAAKLDPKCQEIGNFYWEIGTVNGPVASGSIGTEYDASTTMMIASASKWVYGAFVTELRRGWLTRKDIEALTMKSGYTNQNYISCRTTRTVRECLEKVKMFGGTNGDYNAEDHGIYYYNSGHFQHHYGIELGFANDDNEALAARYHSVLGDGVPTAFDSPQPAGGQVSSACEYASFLRKILSGDLRIRNKLGSRAVCTNVETCPDSKYTPIPAHLSWDYSIGHWVEEDGTFSSPGALGFYPWIDASETYYGIVARRVVGGGGGPPSAECGKAIRNAFLL